MELKPIDSLVLRNMSATVTPGLNAILIRQGDMTILAHLPQEAAALHEWLGRALASPDALHPSHKHVRGSDASSFDMICDDCGAHDNVRGGWGALARPCSPSSAEAPHK